jgi:hypothetical protein
VGVQEVRWDKWDPVRGEDIFLSVENETKITNWEQDFLYTAEQYQLFIE